MHETFDMHHLMQSLWFIFASLQVESPCHCYQSSPLCEFPGLDYRVMYKEMF